MNEVLVTGFSAVTPFGLTNQQFADKMMAGDSTAGPLDSIAPGADFPIKCAALLPPGFYPAPEDRKFGEEIETLLRATLRELILEKESFVPFDGLIFGTNEGLARFADVQGLAQNENYSAEHLDPEFALDVIVQSLAKAGQGPLAPENRIICGGACTTGLLALHYAAQRIRTGLNQRILVVCAESRVRIEELLKLNALGALSRSTEAPARVSRPFSASRSGFVRGEGAGAVILENRVLAESRAAKIYGRILGSAVTSDAWRLTDGREDLSCATRAVEKALKDAGVRPGEIDYINAHGTATMKNDRIETEVLKKIFGSSVPPVSSLKSQIGHLNFASGLVEVIACLLMLEQQRMAPTINYSGQDPECDLDYVPNKSRPAVLDRILKIGFGFGGSNAAVVLGRI